jgi:hypothetical protein
MSSPAISSARARACAAPRSLNGQLTVDPSRREPSRAEDALAVAAKKRSFHPGGVSRRRVRRDEQVATGLKNGPVREADTLGDARDTEVADGVYAGAHDGRRDRDDEAVNELLALRSPTSPAASSCMGH